MSPVLWKMFLLVLSICSASFCVYTGFVDKYSLTVTLQLFFSTVVFFSLAMLLEIVDMIGLQIGALLEGMVAAARYATEQRKSNNDPEFPQE